MNGRSHHTNDTACLTTQTVIFALPTNLTHIASNSKVLHTLIAHPRLRVLSVTEIICMYIQRILPRANVLGIICTQ